MQLDGSVLILIFVVLSLALGALVKSLPRLFIFPYSVVLLIAGLTVGFLGRSEFTLHSVPEFASALDVISSIDPHLILLLFLPTLIFESAFAMETHLFKRMFSQIAILAVPGLILTTCLTALFASVFFPWQWSWSICFLFAALISATDPVAVVSLLKDVSSRKRLETLIEGESLLNDGTAIVLFTLFFGLVTLQESGKVDLFTISGNFVYVVALGLFIGLVTGGLILWWINKLFNKPIIEITLTVSAAYTAYFIAENIFHVSGVVSVVALGLLLASVGRTRISPEVADFLQRFWQMMAHIANTLIFILVGIIIATRIRLDVLDWWVTLIALYIAIQLIRAFSVVLFMPLLKRIGVGINAAKATVLIWGGVRGAVSLALALIVAQDNILGAAFGDQVLFLTAGIVVLTIVINASSMKMVFRYLNLDKLPPAKQASLDKAQFTIKKRLFDELPSLQANEFLQRANWTELNKSVEPSKFVGDISKTEVIQETDLRVAFHRRLLESERQFYWLQFKQGALTGTATRQLVHAVEVALDGEPQISPRETLFKVWKTPNYLRWFNHIRFLNRIIIRFSFERLALSYDTARGFMQAQQEIEKYVLSLAPTDQDAQDAMRDIALNKQYTRLHIQQMRENFPDLSFSLETHSAHRLMLNLERVYLDDLIDEGVLDASEAQKLTHEIEHKLAHLKQQPHHVTAKQISKQLAEMPWAQGVTKKHLITLGKLAKRQIFNEGELIFRQNRHAISVAVVMHGKVELISTHSEQQVSSGEILGIYAFLSGSYKMSAKALTAVEVVWLDINRLKKVIAKDEALSEAFIEHLEHEAHE